ncbi:hypothetical protein BDK51DRAFT_28851 [Blyttiomyces helicus]|uniref:Ku70/Ku80 C-terminal arm domain-containing protein n=1 Tax=Blyttiomyces helicus TaxID=388810 RepID=A0A4P9WMZ4_9FUNG|nr:hypothetical protein BDK51DRAFT_28851 [Blyttiomyces helicus]|eukprot:RKO94449.1 hypothetical protein BDK51DRAFT_28851 [Blyttiomyces helicus]
MWVIYLPFTDDLRDADLPMEGDISHQHVMSPIAKKRTLKKFKIPDYENPSMQTFYAALAKIALNKVEPEPFEDQTLPKTQSIEKFAGKYIKSFNKKFQNMVSMKKRKAAISTDGDSKKPKGNATFEATKIELNPAAQQDKLESLTIVKLIAFLVSVGKGDVQDTGGSGRSCQEPFSGERELTAFGCGKAKAAVTCGEIIHEEDRGEDARRLRKAGRQDLVPEAWLGGNKIGAGVFGLPPTPFQPKPRIRHGLPAAHLVDGVPFKRLFTNKSSLLTLLNSLLPSKVDSILHVERITTRSAPSTPSGSAPSSSAPRSRSTTVSLPQSPFADLEFANTEEVGDVHGVTLVRYDIVAVTSEGVTIIVEMQRAAHTFFAQRMSYYSSRLLVRRQGWFGKRKPRDLAQEAKEEEARVDGLSEGRLKRAKLEEKNWDYRLQPVYVIAICDFDLKKLKDLPDPIRSCYVAWAEAAFDRSRCLLPPPLRRGVPPSLWSNTFLPRIPPGLSPCLESRPNLDPASRKGDGVARERQWVSDIRGDFMHLTDIPPPHSPLQNNSILLQMKLASLTPQERSEYDLDVKTSGDLAVVFSTVREEGREEGRE